jgi:endonuclease G
MCPIRSIVVAVLFLAAPAAAQEKNRNVQFGAPKKIQPFDDPKRENFVITRDEYVLSYNGRKNLPNWVSWNLIQSDIGNVSRGAFEPDPALPRNFDQIIVSTYAGSGFDRGHMCPSKDRSRTEKSNDATFFTTNIIPQAPENNQKGWERIESYCRDLAKKGNSLHIVCGPQGTRGEGKSGRLEVIRRGKIEVTVPAKTWKVIMVLPKGKAVPNRDTRIIAVIMPNDQSVTDDWGKYRVSVRDVEKLTGYQFFPNIPNEVAVAIKATADDERIIQTPRPRP